jgi:uncharacterized protein YeaO (DUF488 family)
MLLEGYLAKLKSYPENECKIIVTRTAHSILAPSKELFEDYKNGKIDWEEYEKRFRKEIYANPQAIDYLKRLSLFAKTCNVRLICYEKKYPCHRFILMDMISEIEAFTTNNTNYAQFDYMFTYDNTHWAIGNRSDWR